MACSAFVFGGGGLLGACEAGMALALLESGVVPDVIVGTSVGAINGVAIAADPSPAGAKRLVEMWQQITAGDVLAGTFLGRLGRLARSGTHLHANEPLRKLLTETLPATRFDELPVRFECVAASIEQAQEHWFTQGDLVPAVLASAALPGVLPPVEIDGEHFLDGGLVNSIPIARALALGADVVYVLHVGRVEEPLVAPERPWDVAFVAFEIARRHRFHTDIRSAPSDVAVHLLPSGQDAQRAATWSNLRYRDVRRINGRVQRAYEATLGYLGTVESPK
ncbi:MAG TPA: patatin-like phospholipase family protein [Mycobacteriales bacterium]|nr:patatin-like phospholipase family protein [Mycobacteriales bacterium]